jgi:hypothetical protein
MTRPVLDDRSSVARLVIGMIPEMRCAGLAHTGRADANDPVRNAG